MARGGNKFAALFQPEPKAEPTAEPPQIAEAPVAVPATAPTPKTARAIGRPPGKRSDPAWKQYSVLLRRETQREAAKILRDKDEGDLSGLVQKLLDVWVKKQRT
jgi:hypothetical protein